MVKFIQKLLYFTLLVTIIFTAKLISNSAKRSYLKQSDEYAYETIIIGDSHAEHGLNPAYFDNAINISQSGEPLIASYWKCKEIFKNQSPKYVIISVAAHNFSGFNDLKFVDEPWRDNQFTRLHSIFNTRDVLNKIPVDWKRLLYIY